MTKQFKSNQFDLFADTDASECSDHYNRKYETEHMSVHPLSDSFGQITKSGQISLSEFYDGELSYLPKWLAPEQADTVFLKLKNSLAWQQDQIRLYGKWVTIPRKQAWYGDPDACYQYSGIEMKPQPWTPLLSQLKLACESACGATFNSVLANFYRHGADSMGMHSDDEPELGLQPVIASVTLGEPRRFDFKHKNDKTRLHINLAHGSLLIMQGNTQQHWQHGIQKTKRTVSERINLTFRMIKVGNS